MIYSFKPSSKFKKQYKKLTPKDKKATKELINRLLNDEILEPKHRDHKLVGEHKDFRECHITPDLLLIYKKEKQILTLVCIAVGSHSELFGK